MTATTTFPKKLFGSSLHPAHLFISPWPPNTAGLPDKLQTKDPDSQDLQQFTVFFDTFRGNCFDTASGVESLGLCLLRAIVAWTPPA